jgi:hypothetical protein
MKLRWLFFSLCLSTFACSGDPDEVSEDGPPVTLGESHAGEYHLGPVELNGTWWNSCAPYADEVEDTLGEMLVGVGLQFNGDGQLCDACIFITTDLGKTIEARVITTGQTNGPNDIDLSPAAYDAIHQNEYPRKMSWQVAKCSSTQKIKYQFQEEAHQDWSSFWVRNVRLPLSKVEVKSARHASFTELDRAGDGTYTDNGGFGPGSFTLRLTAIDGQQMSDTFPKFDSGEVLSSAGNFK